MVHPVVDIERWIGRYPLGAAWARVDAEHGPSFWYNAPSDIFSPRDLALTEQMRAAVGGPDAMGPSLPVDVLLPALGEPPRREVSKIGGLPYRARGPWPTDGAEKPLTFLGQLCLADSRDVLRGFSRDELPGDVLLVFHDDTDDGLMWSEGEGAQLHFEWQPLGLAESDLVTATEVPEQPVAWTATYFERYRSTEHADVRLPLRYRDIDIEVSGEYWASKIGGVPVWQQREDEAEGLGRYFACLHSINPAEDEYPFPNVEKPAWGRHPHSQNFLMLGDVGTLYLFAKGGGKVGWLMQCG
ncbi:MAG: DUF1963 domain-containing protein [Phycisphaerales bacterium JB039]